MSAPFYSGVDSGITSIKPAFFEPQWPVPSNVRALQSTRLGGESAAPYGSLNLGDHVADDVSNVALNRGLLRQHLPSNPLWLQQVHSTIVVSEEQAATNPKADASITMQQRQVCTVMTADCLPVLFCNKAGTQVAAAHAGWRGLVDGILENTLTAFAGNVEDVLIWLGPAIGPDAFEVGQEVQEAFCLQQPEAKGAFKRKPLTNAHEQNKWLADLYSLAKLRLMRAGISSNNIYGGGFCTFTDKQRFFSYRRDGVTGRMASCIWIK